ncbi:MAG: redoxin family protein [Planctomycetes bacterium]|nr:redoxin family protein [Planctomycetota bacterium]
MNRATVSLALLTAAFAGAQEPVEKPSEPVAQKPYALMVGDRAPALEISRWVKGDPVDGFADGKVYVVEFWATWCGPCIAGMPHLSELQKEYADKPVQIIGVNIWDEPKNVDPFMQAPIKMHGKSGDEVMQYTVAIEAKPAEGDQRNGKLSETWMKAAGRNGIPSAFVVDGAGKIAWIGHPSGIDGPLAKIAAGTWDLTAQAKAYAEEVAASAKIDGYFEMFRTGKYDRAYALGHELVDGPMRNNASQLNSLAWAIVDPDNKPAKVDLKLAVKAAMRANELTEQKDPAILDTLAVALWQDGELDKALAIQTKAVAHAKGTQFETELKARLEQLKREAAKKAADEASAEKDGDAVEPPKPDSK